MVTSQLVASDREAYVASCKARSLTGPNGEQHTATIWHTLDRGVRWNALPWRRRLHTWVSRAVFAPWPPEYVVMMKRGKQGLEIEFWEDWGLCGALGENAELGVRTEPIWRAWFVNSRWSLRMHRRWKVSDGPFGARAIDLALPGFTTPRVMGSSGDP